jgi:hypothetical protein
MSGYRSFRHVLLTVPILVFSLFLAFLGDVAQARRYVLPHICDPQPGIFGAGTTALPIDDDLSARLAARPSLVPTGMDTIYWGYYEMIGEVAYAVEGEAWTFDHEPGTLEGWSSIDLTTNLRTYFAHTTLFDFMPDIYEFPDTSPP